MGRFVFITMFMVLAATPFTAQARTAVTKDAANAYYTACMEKDDKRLTEEAHISLCSCTAAKMMTTLSMEDINAMNDKAGPGRDLYNKMLADSYGPCMQVAIQDELDKECMTDSRINQFGLKDKASLCQCVGIRTGNFIAAESPAIVQQILKNKPDVTDLYAAFLDNNSVRQTAYDNVTACLHSNNQ